MLGKRVVGLYWIFGLLLALLLLSCQAATPPATQAPAKSASSTSPAPTMASTTQSTAQPTAAPAAAPTPAVVKETLKVGIATSITGAANRIGMNVDRFVRMSIDDINARGGIKIGNKAYQLEAVTVDDKGTPDGARDAASRLVLAEKVKLVMGTLTSPTAGAQAVTEPNKVMLIGYAALDSSLGPKFPLTISGGISHAIMRFGALYDYFVKEHPGTKRVAFVTPDEPTGRSYSQQAEKQAKAHGMELVGKEFYPLDTKDFNVLATRVIRMNPDAIDVAGAGGRGALFAGLMKALREQGYNKPVFGVSADLGVLRTGGAEMEGFITSIQVDRKATVIPAGEREVDERYVQKYKEEDIELHVTSSYNIPWLFAQAAERAGTVDDNNKIVEVMRQGEWDTMWSKETGKSKLVGAQTFGLPSIPEQPIFISALKDGKLQTFYSLKGTLP